jgi:hypothetical protein
MAAGHQHASTARGHKPLTVSAGAAAPEKSSPISLDSAAGGQRKALMQGFEAPDDASAQYEINNFSVLFQFVSEIILEICNQNSGLGEFRSVPPNIAAVLALH